MPRFDRTGPMGQGAMIGGGRGYCAVALNGIGVRPGNGRGSYGRGGGHGFRNCLNATGLPGWMRAQRGIQAFGGFGRAVLKEDELAVLKSQAGYLKDELDVIQTRVQNLEGNQEEGK